MADKSTTDWFARITAILGLLVAVLAIFIPYFQSKQERQEHLNIIALPEGVGGIIKLSNDLNRSRAVQIPWVFTLSNTGQTKLSIISYSISEIKVFDANWGRQCFPGLDGGAFTRENTPVIFPTNLDSGESISFRIHIGFEPTDKVQKIFRELYSKRGALEAHMAFSEFAKLGMTIYGGTAIFQQFENEGRIISIDSSSRQVEPVYRIAFKTGRGHEFVIVKSATNLN